MSKSTVVMETIAPEALTKYVRFLVGSFRIGEADDGEIMTRGLTALLASYPEFVVRAVCDPRSGLPATSKFFPTLYEVRSACEAKMRPLLEAERRRRLRAEAEADVAAPVSEAERERRSAVVAAWRAAQPMRDAEAAGAGSALADLDARRCQGEQAEIVKRALSDRLSRLSADYRSTPAVLSGAALRAIAPELVA